MLIYKVFVLCLSCNQKTKTLTAMKRVQQLNQMDEMIRLLEKLNEQSTKLIERSTELENEVTTRINKG